MGKWLVLTLALGACYSYLVWKMDSWVSPVFVLGLLFVINAVVGRIASASRS
ncbi:MAG TPA: hypothetical protein VIG60_10885 [Savagea sp.]